MGKGAERHPLQLIRWAALSLVRVGHRTKAGKGKSKGIEIISIQFLEFDTGRVLTVINQDDTLKALFIVDYWGHGYI